MAAPSAAPLEIDTSGWPTKGEAARVLGCSEKSVERYALRGALESRWRAQQGKRSISVYSPDSVDALRVQLAGRVSVLPADRASSEIATVRLPTELEGLSAILAGLSRFAEENNAKYSRPVYMSLDEASALTGLGRRTIKELASSGKIATLPYDGNGGARYRRADLEAL
jgi:hypothetical protein